MRLIFLAVLALSFAACDKAGAQSPATPQGAPTRQPQRVTGAEARKFVAAGALLLDVRTPDEFNELHLDGARNIPVSDVQRALPTLPKDKPIVVYCAVGSRSAMAASILAAAGFDVKNLGAMGNWNQ